MKHVNRERIKSIVLIALFIISLIQVGILWSKQSHRLPISFLSGIFSRPRIPVTDEITRDELFLPYRLVLSNGEQSHWILDRKDPEYKLLWEETKEYLTAILNGNLTLSAASQESWGDITSKKGFVFEFKTAIRPDLLKWFLGDPNSSVELPSVYKIMILPDSNNNSLNTIYFYDMNNTNRKIYKYQSRELVRKKSFTEILAPFQEEGQTAYREYNTMHDSKFDERWDTEPDVLLSTSPAFWPYRILSCSVPDRAANEDGLAEALLGSQKERYVNKKYNDGVIQFNTTENLYKIYPDGTLEFQNFSEADSGVRGNIGAALLNAYDFIKKAESVTNRKADIYLSEMELLPNGAYRFYFDYMVEGYPVHIDVLLADSGDKTTHAVTIEANSRRVLSCRYILRDFAEAGKNSYYDRFLEVMNDGNISYQQLQIKDIGVGYVMDSIDDGQLEPYIVLENKGTGLITKKLDAQKGD